jgi:hypothetical protein
MKTLRRGLTNCCAITAGLLLSSLGCGEADEATQLPPPGTELLENGDFVQGLEPWSGTAQDPANVTYAADSGEAVIDVHPLGVDSTGIQFAYTTGLSLHQAKQYRLTFRARATPDRAIRVSIWENGHDLDHNGFPWSSHQANEHDLTSTMSSYTVEWTMPVTNTDAGLCFFMTATPGSSVPIDDGEVVIDDVSLINLD